MLKKKKNKEDGSEEDVTGWKYCDRKVCSLFTGMEISEEQRKQAILNARRAKQGNKSRNVFSACEFIAFTLICNVESCPFFIGIGYSGSVPPHHQNLHPLHQRHITIPTSVPQQQVFSLAEPPKRKTYHLLYSITRNAFFRK